MPRLFIALRPPPPVRDTLLAAMGDDGPGIRWQDEDQLHLTLAFLGEVDAHRGDELIESLAAIRAETFEIELRGVGHFERKGAPSALWAAVLHNPALDRLHTRVICACRRAGVEPDGRGFRPHVTLARLNRSGPPAGGWLAANGTLTAGPWPVDEFRLYESRLSPAGAQYEPVMSFRIR